MPKNRTRVGVYYLDAVQRVWRLIPEALITNDGVVITTDHLTDFVIFDGTGLPPLISAVAAALGFDGLPETLPAGSAMASQEQPSSSLSEPLFDISITIKEMRGQLRVEVCVLMNEHL